MLAYLRVEQLDAISRESLSAYSPPRENTLNILEKSICPSSERDEMSGELRLWVLLIVGDEHNEWFSEVGQSASIWASTRELWLKIETISQKEYKFQNKTMLAWGELEQVIFIWGVYEQLDLGTGPRGGCWWLGEGITLLPLRHELFFSFKQAWDLVWDPRIRRNHYLQ